MPEEPAPQPKRPLSTYTWLSIVLGLLLVLVILYRGTQVAVVPASAELRKWALVPAFSLTERSGRTVTNKDLAGKIWVADFIYTTCPGPCPLITESMAKVQDTTEKDPQVMLVTFTVDPQTDTPPVLAKYADVHHANPNSWWFLTGPEKQLYDLIQNGFYQVVEDNHGKKLEDGQYIVTHSTKLVLIDGEGYMRGYYDGIDASGRGDLLRDIKILEKEEKP